MPIYNKQDQLETEYANQKCGNLHFPTLGNLVV